MSKTQDKWNNYYADKQWIDTKGWCDLNGNPYDFKDKDEFPRNRQPKFTCELVKVSFILQVFKCFRDLLFFWGLYTFLLIVFNRTYTSDVIFTLIWVLGSICSVIGRFVYIIVCIARGNLKL